jgi:hypothetical protein
VFDFFDDVFQFFTTDVPAAAANQAEEEAESVDDAGQTLFDAWQDSAGDFFDLLEDAAEPWGDPAQDFVGAWQQATESFADQFAGWFGWSNDDSPV